MLVINYGNDAIKITYDALVSSDMALYLKKGCSVAIKPNLVVARPASDGATTHPEVVEGIIRFLLDHGNKDIRIIESSWVGESTKRAYKACGYEDLSKKYGIRLVDLKTDGHTALTYGGYRIDVCNEALNTDFLINVPVLKAHCQTSLTCCMKNLKGCIPDGEKRRFHTLGIHKPVAALNMLVKTGYCVVDGICGDLSFEEGGNPVESNRVIVGRDPLMVDSYCSELIGYRPDEIGYLRYGMEYGLGSYYSKDTRILELNAQDRPLTNIKDTKDKGAADRYKGLIDEDSACSACYSSLIYALHRSGRKVNVDGKIHIGQGFKGRQGTGLGVGNCTNGFTRCVKGCPPKAVEIMEAIV